MASHPSERHVDTGGETPPTCPRIPDMSICCTQIIDQAHDQANGEIIGVTEDPSALIRWMIAGPEVSQLFAQYDSLRSKGDCCTYEPSRTSKAQQVFLERIDQLFQVFTDMGNHFNDESRDLLSLDPNDIAIPSAAELIFTHHDRGRTRFVAFMD